MTRPLRITAAPDVVFQKLDGRGGGVIMHLQTTHYFQVNELGAAIWSIVEDGATFEQLFERLRASLEAAPPELEGDVTRFVEGLRERELVTVEPVV